MFSLIARSSVSTGTHELPHRMSILTNGFVQKAPMRRVRLFHVSSLRSNLIQDLYIKELRAFKPKALTAADAEEATKSWKLPAASKIPALENEGADALAEYDSTEVEMAAPKNAAALAEEDAAAKQSYNEDDWFVFEEDDVTA
ncbi:hypothetical protein FOA43_001571 [Brettanomyces nanus]|uniref:Uncharacterized protein n=1 Tax=Eeniella nana TaxID=13502 RepID=A0A875RYL9_EENNA|nr:uncharacterized protein FOA43_001571 [Brettanomyces nanus]QPG74246.1 hypothetical protein FOA43_001571 [Brettanomyces nanus]